MGDGDIVDIVFAWFGGGDGVRSDIRESEERLVGVTKLVEAFWSSPYCWLLLSGTRLL